MLDGANRLTVVTVEVVVGINVVDAAIEAEAVGVATIVVGR